MNLTGLKAVEFEGSLIGVSYTNGDEVVGIPTSPKNRMYQELLDSINNDGADAWEESVATYADIPEALRTAAESKLFNQQLADYRVAVARLTHYRLADGREEVREMQPTGEQVWNEETMETEDVMHEVIVQTAIDPLEPTIEIAVYDENAPMAEPIMQTVANPEIVKDDAERAEAQAVIDATPIEVKEADVTNE